MSQAASTTRRPDWLQVRRLLLAGMGGLGLLFALSLLNTDDVAVGTGPLAVVAVAGLAALVLGEVVGRTVVPVRAADPVLAREHQARSAFWQVSMLRLAIGVGLGLFAVSVAGQHGDFDGAVACAGLLVGQLVLWLALPRDRTLDQLARALEREGADSRLRAAIGA